MRGGFPHSLALPHFLHPGSVLSRPKSLSKEERGPAPAYIHFLPLAALVGGFWVEHWVYNPLPWPSGETAQGPTPVGIHVRGSTPSAPVLHEGPSRSPTRRPHFSVGKTESRRGCDLPENEGSLGLRWARHLVLPRLPQELTRTALQGSGQAGAREWLHGSRVLLTGTPGSAGGRAGSEG